MRSLWQQVLKKRPIFATLKHCADGAYERKSRLAGVFRVRLPYPFADRNRRPADAVHARCAIGQSQGKIFNLDLYILPLISLMRQSEIKLKLVSIAMVIDADKRKLKVWILNKLQISGDRQRALLGTALELPYLLRRYGLWSLYINLRALSHIFEAYI